MTHQPETTLCTASIENEHTHGRQHCTRPAGHTNSHASPLIADEGIAGQAGRIYWDDAYVGAVPHQPAAVSAAVAPPTNHGLSLPHADALYDAIATPGPARESFDDQHARVCAVVRQILDDLLPTPAEPTDRAAVLHEVADELTRKANKLTERVHDLAYFVARDRLREAEILDREATELRRMADETATETPSMRLARQSVQAMTDTLQRACPPGCVACATDESHDPGPAAGARQEATATDEPAPGSTEPRPCRTFVSGGAVWCCEEGEADCPCVCHQPAAGARQDETATETPKEQ
ncbi:hypothetical protein [Streptomyces pseudogriseolus]|uniref:hypothetical protein n=1 Tax=Streptomyces pseudogriseolus TaxID=36817 RepID=UPI0036668076